MNKLIIKKSNIKKVSATDILFDTIKCIDCAIESTCDRKHCINLASRFYGKENPDKSKSKSKILQEHAEDFAKSISQKLDLEKITPNILEKCLIYAFVSGYNQKI